MVPYHAIITKRGTWYQEAAGMFDSPELGKRDKGVARRRLKVRVVGLRRDDGTL